MGHRNRPAVHEGDRTHQIAPRLSYVWGAAVVFCASEAVFSDGAVTTVLAALIGVILPFPPIAAMLGFVPLPGAYLVFLDGVTVNYLVLGEVVKRRLMRKLLGRGAATSATKSVTPAS